MDAPELRVRRRGYLPDGSPADFDSAETESYDRADINAGIVRRRRNRRVAAANAAPPPSRSVPMKASSNGSVRRVRSGTETDTRQPSHSHR